MLFWLHLLLLQLLWPFVWPFRICAFNVQHFADKKAANGEVMEILVKIVQRCDICLLQEVQDPKGRAVSKLLLELNRSTDLFLAVSSPSLGRLTYKEQYVFIYKSDKISLSDHYLYDDNDPAKPDVFAREPYVVRFRLLSPGLQDLLVIPQHTEPTKAAEELQALYDVAMDARSRTGCKDIVIMGDFNADCSYLSNKKKRDLRLYNDPDFYWAVADYMDTTVKQTTNCSYDKIVVYGKKLKDMLSFAGIYDFPKELGLTEGEIPAHTYLLPFLYMTFLPNVMTNGSPIKGTQYFLICFWSFIAFSNGVMRTPVFLLFLLGLHVSTATFKICSFNIKTFGEAKASNKKIMDALVKILTRCDISVIQEVRDSKGEAVPALVTELNRYDGIHWYKHLESKRLGKNSYKEQYAFIYRSDTVKLVDWYQYVEDNPDDPDAFAREPFIVRFRSSKTVVKEFVLMSHHTCPREAGKEISRLLQVMLDVKSRWKIENIMLLGDLNAACGYVTVDEWKNIQLQSSKTFHWLISDKEDTTVNKRTHCAYDRIVVHGEEFLKAIVPGSAKPYNFQKKLGLTEEEALEVSDHFPVEVHLRIDPRTEREL
ncbi:uncharacterized protein PAF06_002792 [Gastrophryne carolinensis]